MAPNISRDTKPNIRRRIIAGLVSVAALVPLAPSPTVAPAATVEQGQRQAPRPSRDQLPAPVRDTQRMVRHAIGGGFHAVAMRKEPIWTGRLRDGGFHNTGVNRRKMRGSRR